MNLKTKENRIIINEIQRRHPWNKKALLLCFIHLLSSHPIRNIRSPLLVFPVNLIHWLQKISLGIPFPLPWLPALLTLSVHNRTFSYLNWRGGKLNPIFSPQTIGHITFRFLTLKTSYNETLMCIKLAFPSIWQLISRRGLGGVMWLYYRIGGTTIKKEAMAFSWRDFNSWINWLTNLGQLDRSRICYRMFLSLGTKNGIWPRVHRLEMKSTPKEIKITKTSNNDSKT